MTQNKAKFGVLPPAFIIAANPSDHHSKPKKMPSDKRSSITQFLHLRNLDFLGSEFQLKYTKNGRFQTKLGGVITLLVFLFMMVVAYTTFKDFMSTKAPVATISTVYSRKAPKFDLYKEEIF